MIAETFGDEAAVIVLENRTGQPPMQRDIEWLRGSSRTDQPRLKAELDEVLETEVTSGRMSPTTAQRLRHPRSHLPSHRWGP